MKYRRIYELGELNERQLMTSFNGNYFENTVSYSYSMVSPRGNPTKIALRFSVVFATHEITIPVGFTGVVKNPENPTGIYSGFQWEIF